MTTVLFGIDVSTSARPGADPVADARRAERAGFDFVSASDHPGAPAQPNFETWTMLTWIAAATSRITVTTRVLGVPFRAPAMVAKAAESLDRLSAGRLIVGLGAGGSDEELRSFGAPGRGAGDKVRGLEDAVAIIRGLWEESAFSYDGPIYRVDRAHLEPKPTRQIPIWLGTFGDRALAVTGRIADGWIPSLGHAPAERIPTMRSQVLAAAERAGRQPDAITCALNLEVRLDDQLGRDPDEFIGPPDKIAGALLRYVGLGFTAFNLMTAGEHAEDQVDRLAAEVLPAVRAG